MRGAAVAIREAWEVRLVSRRRGQVYDQQLLNPHQYPCLSSKLLSLLLVTMQEVGPFVHLALAQQLRRHSFRSLRAVPRASLTML